MNSSALAKLMPGDDEPVGSDPAGAALLQLSRADRRRTIARIREFLDKHELRPSPALAISCTHNLYDAGLRSRGAVTLMLALEEAFEVEFPDCALNRRTFSTLRAIA